MSSTSEKLFSVRRHRLLVLARADKPETFQVAFIATVQDWAKEFGFTHVTTLTADVTIGLLGWAGGGTTEQAKLLLHRIGIELTYPDLHQLAKSESLGDLARRCYQHLRTPQ